jgi:hypothetical protein
MHGNTPVVPRLFKGGVRIPHSIWDVRANPDKLSILMVSVLVPVNIIIGWVNKIEW